MDVFDAAVKRAEKKETETEKRKDRTVAIVSVISSAALGVAGLLVGCYQADLASRTLESSENNRRQDKEEAVRPILAVKEPSYRMPHDVAERAKVIEVTNVGQGLAANVGFHWILNGTVINSSVSSPRHIISGSEGYCQWFPPELTLGGALIKDDPFGEFYRHNAEFRMTAQGVDGRTYNSKQTVEIDIPAKGKEPITLRFGNLQILPPEAKPDSKQ